MDWTRLGLVIRALRRRKGWRQVDVARIARVSQTLISLVERGHGERVTGEAIRRIAAAVDARVVVELRWRGGEIDRLLDAGHAALVDAMARRLRAWGWTVHVEVTYETPRSSGSIDLLAWHPETRTLLVIEIKTELTSAEATIRKLDEKSRLAANLARVRFGWHAASVSRLLVVESSSTNRRRIQAHRSLFDGAFPVRDGQVRRWLRIPSGPVSGRLFVSASNPGAGVHARGGRHRVRAQRAAPACARVAPPTTEIPPRDGSHPPWPTILRG